MDGKTLFLWVLMVGLFACQPQQKTHQAGEANHLANSSSPYLLQHAHNPVDWYPWGDEALGKAKKENKLLVISIGYAACHWCHVMEKESFADTAIAQLMNKDFVSIKVDREERPDIDQIYMEAAQLMTGNGGWPLNVIALPDGRPVFAGTYFPKDDWEHLLQRITAKFQEDPDAFEKVAQQVTEGIRVKPLVKREVSPTDYTSQDLEKLFENWQPNIDFELGGLKGSPKFPMPTNATFLLQYYFHSNHPSAKKAVESTLQNMAAGGIYDHLGGGFSRYSTDAKWFAPHFEKMLYDNALLVSLYAQAYRFDKKPQYKKVVVETLDFVERELMASEGAFFTSLNADSEGEEGMFYTWKKSEVDALLGEAAQLFNAYFGVTERGNWEEGRNILSKVNHGQNLMESFELSVPELESRIETAKKKLWETRGKRERPSLDDKVLTSWNALMISAYTQAYRSFGEEKYLQIALANAHFLQENMIEESGNLYRNYKDGKVSISAFLDDYANLINAFTDLYQVTFDEHWLVKADKLTTYVLENFYDDATGMFYYTADSQGSLIARKMELQDNVMPSSNSQMARNLYLLGTLLYNEGYKEKAIQMLGNVKGDMLGHGEFHSNWGLLLLDVLYPPYEVAIVGENVAQLRKELGAYFLANSIMLGGKEEGQLALLEGKLMEGETVIYVCQDKVCKRPVFVVKDAIEQMHKSNLN